MRPEIWTTIVGMAVILLMSISISLAEVPVWRPDTVTYYPPDQNYLLMHQNYLFPQFNLSMQYDWLTPDYLYQGWYNYDYYNYDYYYDYIRPSGWLWGGVPAPHPAFRSYRYDVVYPIYRWPDHPLQDPYSFISSNVDYGFVSGQPVVVLGKSWVERFNQSTIFQQSRG